MPTIDPRGAAGTSNVGRPILARNEIPFREHATCTINQACAATGLGRTLLYELIGEKLIQSTLVKGRRLVHVPSLLKAVGVKPDSEWSEVR
jgi:hypothetical protein